ncbi:MAG: M23 family metallopeptidase, partial [Candidatus Paceibacteria bacterium]
DINRNDKNTLLSITKNKESSYEKLLVKRKMEKEKFEDELRNLESQLQFELDPDSIPAAEKGVLAWPLEKVKITQYFGNTEFAKSGGYKGEGHNGMDFRASSGTKVKAALAGEVIAVNTQVAYMCQYGKWVLVRHANGLTTLYAHLSLIPDRIKVGQQVSTGQIIGYSGNTGYATGPHLHFTVYASKAVQFKQYTCNSGATLTIPVAAYSGYLNPMDYL